MSYYTEAELYAGSTYGIIGYKKNGQAIYGHTKLDPAKQAASSAYHYPQKTPKPPKPPQLAVSTQAGVGQGTRKPSKKRSKVRISDLLLARKNPYTDAMEKKSSPLSIGSGGTGLNVGGY